jgi:hypothetical protein
MIKTATWSFGSGNESYVASSANATTHDYSIFLMFLSKHGSQPDPFRSAHNGQARKNNAQEHSQGEDDLC